MATNLKSSDDVLKNLSKSQQNPSLDAFVNAVTNSNKGLSDKAKQQMAIISQVEKAGAAGKFGTTINVRNAKGEVEAQFKSAMDAYKAGALTNPTLSGLATANKVYREGKGWTTKEPTNTVITFDPKTGKITVKGPSRVVEDSEFQDRFGILETLSSNYKKDPTVTYPALDAEGKETSGTWTTQDFINYLNRTNKTTGLSPVQSIVNQFVEANAIKDSVAEMYRQMNEDGSITPVQLSYDDVMRLSAFDPTNEKNDGTRIAIPKNWDSLSAAYRAPSWDEATGTLTIKDFQETFYNREKRSEKEILSTYMELERYLNKSKITQAGSVNTDEWTGAYALYNYMTTHDPNCAWYQGLGDLAGAIASAPLDVGMDIATLAITGGAKIIDTVWNLSVSLNERLGQIEEGEYESLNLAKTAFKEFSDVHKTIKATFGFGLSPEEAYILKDNTLTLNRTAEFVEGIGEFLLKAYIFIGAGNAMEEAVAGKLGKLAAKTSEAEMSLQGASTLQSLMGANGTAAWMSLFGKALTNPIVSFSLKKVGETFGEALLQDPETLGAILASDKLTDEGTQYLWETYYNNFIYGAAAVGVGKGLMKVGETTWGRAASINFRNKFVFPLQKNLGDYMDSIRIKLANLRGKGISNIDEYIDGIKSTQKQDVMRARRTLRDLKAEIGKKTDWIEVLGKNKDDLLETIAKAEDNMDKLYKLEAAIDDLQRSGQLTIAKWRYGDDYINFKNANGKIKDLTTDLLQAEKRAGIKSAAKTTAGALFSQATTDYIGASVRVPILENAAKVFEDLGDKKTLKAINEELSHWRGFIDNYRKVTDASVLEAADKYVGAYKNWWQESNRLFIGEGLLSETEIAAYKKRGEWGDNGELYARLQRQQEMNDYIIVRRDGKATRETVHELGHYKYGSTESFVDPTLVMEHEMQQRALESLSRQIVVNGSVAASTVVDAGVLKVRDEIKPLLKQFNAEVSRTVQPTLENLSNKGFFDNLGKKFKSSIEGKVVEGAADLETSIYKTAQEAVSDVKDAIFTPNSKASQLADKMATQYFGGNVDEAKDFLAYEALYTHRKSISNAVAKEAESNFNEIKIKGKGAEGKVSKAAAKEAGEAIEAEIEVQRNAIRAKIAADPKNPANALIDHKKWQQEIYDTAKEIADIEEGDNIVAIRNESGETELVEVDPLIAAFITTKSAAKPMGAFDKVNNLWMRFFRAGTTGISPKSMTNQMFRDLGNAWIMGNVTQTITGSTKMLSDLFGTNVADLMSSYGEDTVKYFQEMAEKQGKTIQEVVAESEIARGKLVAEASTETEAYRLYKQTRSMWYADGTASVSGLDRTNSVLEKIVDKLGKPNEVRETYLRRLVYANNYASAIKNGRSVEQARNFAEYIASNATTNFTRGTTFLTNMQNSIPYLRSAINGTRSFWRLWSLDPVGVTGRLMGGFGMPVMYLTAQSLSSEENRKTYEKFKDYQKDNALPIVMNGQATSIPLPQELSPFLNPIRQMVEGVMGMNKGAGLEIVMSDILNLSPLDLGGFTDIDSYRIFGEGPSWTERMSRGGAQVFSQIMPKYITAAATVMTGKDLYTGRDIDTSYVTVDPDTGDIRTIDYVSGALANKIHEIFPDLAAPIAQEMLENIFGTAGTNILSFLVDLGDQVVSEEHDFAGALGRGLETLVSDASSPLTPYLEHPAETEWRRTMAELWDEKKQLLVGDAWQAYQTNHRNATTPTEIQAAATARANIIDPFYSKVKDTVLALVKNNPDFFTPNKYAAVISLMNTQIATAAGNAYTDQLQSDLYTEAKRAAVQTMVRMGFPSTATGSVFGRYVSTSTGGAYIDYANPLELLNIQNTIYSQGNIYAAELESIVKKNGLNNMDEVWTKIKAAKSTAEKDKIKAEWDIKVGKAIQPLVQQYGANIMSSATAVTDYLDSILLVPSSYTKKNGKSTYHSNLDQQRGFAKAFIKDVFGGIDK